MELTGRVIDVLPTEKGTSAAGKEWQKLTFAIEVQDNYPYTVAFEVFGDEKVNAFNNKIGDEVKVAFNLKSNEWKGKYFTSASAWKIETINSGNVEQKEPDTFDGDDDKNNLPF